MEQSTLMEMIFNSLKGFYEKTQEMPNTCTINRLCFIRTKFNSNPRDSHGDIIPIHGLRILLSDQLKDGEISVGFL